MTSKTEGDHEDFLRAVDGGDFAAASRLVLAGVDLNSPCDQGATLLFAAILGGDEGLITLMLEKGANPNFLASEPAATIYCEKPLDLAMQACFLLDRDKFNPIVAILVEYGATESA